MTPALLLLFLAFVAYVVVTRQRHVRLKTACLAAFEHAYALTAPPPTFEMAYAYGEPTFAVHFASQSDRAAAAAAGANDTFLRAIDALCKDRGRRRRPFQARRAVFFLHPPGDAADAAGPVRACCERMQAQLETARRDAAASLIAYAADTGAYALYARAAGGRVVTIDFCPWCGTGLDDAQTKSRAR